MGGVIKHFRFDWEKVMWEMSYQNLSMSIASLPVYEGPEEKEKKEEQVDGLDQLSDFINDFG